MESMRIWLATIISLAACAAPTGTGDPGTGDPGTGDPGTGGTGHPITPLVIDGLEPGWLVTTTTLADGASAADATTVSDGSPITIAGADGTRVFATVTDGDGALISTQTVRTPCSPLRSHQRRVPSQYETIQAAIDAADPGDTVAVAPGRYTESLIMRPGVCLLGSGAALTVLDAQGEARTLVDLSEAPGSTVSGFTFRGVTGDAGCADPFDCSGNWHRAGVFVSGEGVGAEGLGDDGWTGPSQKSPALIFGNVFSDNEIGVMLNFHGIGIVRNNVFVGNRTALVANHFQDHSLVANNVFIDNKELAIGNAAAYLDILENIIVGSDVAIRFAHVQTGAIRCNLFFENRANQSDDYIAPPRFVLGQDGNLDLDPRLVDATAGDYHLTPGSPAIDRGCFGGHEPDGTPHDLGVYGGPLARSITL